MSQRSTISTSRASGLKVSRRDARVFLFSTVLMTTIFAGALNIDSQFNGGRVGSALVSHSQMASLDKDICSASRFMN